MKLLATLFFSLILLNGFSQLEKEKVLAHFDYVDYYPDSTIRSAHQYTGVNLERFTVEFSAAGAPVAMGKYHKGVKTGEWIYSDGSFDIFDEKFPKSTHAYDHNSSIEHSGAIRPGCGTGIFRARKEFDEKYQKLIHPEAENE